MTGDHTLAIIVSYLTVACTAWAYGYICRVWVERRHGELDGFLAGPLDFEVVDLADRLAYDWAIDGECVGALR